MPKEVFIVSISVPFVLTKENCQAMILKGIIKTQEGTGSPKACLWGTMGLSGLHSAGGLQ